MRNGKVLLVDDSADDAAFVRMAFKRSKISQRLEVVTSGSEAIEYLEGAGRYADRNKYPLPSLLLLDLRMPVMDGFEVIRRLRGHGREGLRRLPIAVLTGSEYPPDRQRAYELGANSFMVKPGGLDEFFAMIDAVMGFWLKCCELPETAA
jgi:CheY-like chemotaxis protein